MYRTLLCASALLATSASGQTGSSSGMPDIAVNAKPFDCGSSIIKLAPTVLQPVASVCEILNAALPIFAKRDKTRVAPRIPYLEDDEKFYVPLLTTAAEAKGKPFIIPVAVPLTVNDFYSIGANGRRPKLGLVLDYIKANGGNVNVVPTTISDKKISKPWIAAIVSFLVKKAQGNPLKGFKKYDAVFFVSPGGDLYQTRIDHICFNRRGSGNKDCLDAPQKW